MAEWRPYNPGNLPTTPSWKPLGAEGMMEILRRQSPEHEFRTRPVGFFGKVIIEFRPRPPAQERPQPISAPTLTADTRPTQHPQAPSADETRRKILAGLVTEAVEDIGNAIHSVVSKAANSEPRFSHITWDKQADNPAFLEAGVRGGPATIREAIIVLLKGFFQAKVAPTSPPPSKCKAVERVVGLVLQTDPFDPIPYPVVAEMANALAGSGARPDDFRMLIYRVVTALSWHLPTNEPNPHVPFLRQHTLETVASLARQTERSGIARADALGHIVALAQALRETGYAEKAGPQSLYDFVIKNLSDLAYDITRYDVGRDKAFELIIGCAQILGKDDQICK